MRGWFGFQRLDASQLGTYCLCAQFALHLFECLWLHCMSLEHLSLGGFDTKDHEEGAEQQRLPR